MKQAWMHWSGGKDSAYTLWKLSQDKDYHVAGLVTSLSAEHRRVSMHGVRENLLEAQAQALGLPLEKLFLPKDCSMADYDTFVSTKMNELKQLGAEVSVFGDIFLEDLRNYRESQMKKVGMASHFPIWKEADTAEIAQQIIQSGVKAIVVCVSGKHFDSSFLGRQYDADFLNDLPEGVDPCGENGEFHTFVYDSPSFSHSIPYVIGERVNKSYTAGEGDEDCDCCQTWDTEFHFLDLELG